MAFGLGLIAVSYTHLDVYKRQGQAILLPGQRTAGGGLSVSASDMSRLGAGGVGHVHTDVDVLPNAHASYSLPDLMMNLRFNGNVGALGKPSFDWVTNPVSYTHLDVYKRQYQYPEFQC